MNREFRGSKKLTTFHLFVVKQTLFPMYVYKPRMCAKCRPRLSLCSPRRVIRDDTFRFNDILRFKKVYS